MSRFSAGSPPALMAREEQGRGNSESRDRGVVRSLITELSFECKNLGCATQSHGTLSATPVLTLGQTRLLQLEHCPWHASSAAERSENPPQGLCVVDGVGR
jgi:hypothetical protein